MFKKLIFTQLMSYSKFRSSRKVVFSSRRSIHLTTLNNKNEENNSKGLVPKGAFENVEDKNKNTYLDMIHIYVENNVHRRGHVEFVYAALKNMESFGVHKDLEVYKALVDVLPKGKFIPTNIIQVEFMHYPKQQQCIIDLLEQMEDNGVMPDYEMEDILLNVFGNKGYPLRKFWRMMYWMPKFKNLSPWPLPDPVPSDIFELAKLAIARISSADVQAKLTVYETREIADAIEDTWIVSAQSPVQKRLLGEHNSEEPVYVEGAFRVWLKEHAVNYFILRANPKPVIEEKLEDPDDVSHIQVPFFTSSTPPKKQLIVYPSVHEQQDGTIMAVCATGTSSKDSLLSWIRHLEKDGNPALATTPIVFTLRTVAKEIANVEGDQNTDAENTVVK